MTPTPLSVIYPWSSLTIKHGGHHDQTIHNRYPSPLRKLKCDGKAYNAEIANRIAGIKSPVARKTIIQAINSKLVLPAQIPLISGVAREKLRRMKSAKVDNPPTLEQVARYGRPSKYLIPGKRGLGRGKMVRGKRGRYWARVKPGRVGVIIPVVRVEQW